MIRKPIEELLENLWTAEEFNHPPVNEYDPKLLEDLRDNGLVTTDSSSKPHLTDEGREKARPIIRRHRLAERLLHDVLGIQVDQTESDACEFEHIVAPELITSICILLGHPRKCPHGFEIPEGDCCREALHVVESVVVPLDKLKAGETAKVAYINTQTHPRLHKLMSFGIVPNVIVHVHQTLPTYVIQCENTQIALDKDIVKDIFVIRELEKSVPQVTTRWRFKKRGGKKI
ncbi:MAG: metal-dependent transcriptional regulator [bacterium]